MQQPQPPAMLHVWSLSGQELLTIPSDELTDVLHLQRRLSAAIGVPRFRQRLLHNGMNLNGSDINLASLDHIQLLVVPFLEPSLQSLAHFYDLASRGRVTLEDLEKVLQRPQDPNAANRDGETLLHCLACAGDVEKMQLALEAGANKDLLP